MEIELRDVLESDFPIFFEHQRDPASAWMAAFGAKDPDRDALTARWRKSLSDESMIQRAIVVNHAVVGFVASFKRAGQFEVTYWIDRTHWGRGIATGALCRLLPCVTTRPLHASAAKDNIGSLRVLAKCGFVVRSSRRAFANARGEEIDEVLMELG